MNDQITKKGKNVTLMVGNHGLLRCCWSLGGGSSCCSWRKSHRAERRDLMVKAPTLWLNFHLRRGRIARPPLPASGESSSTGETLASGCRRERVARRFLGRRCVPARTSYLGRCICPWTNLGKEEWSWTLDSVWWRENPGLAATDGT